MHKSLRPATNLILIAVTASVVIAAMLLSSPSKVLHMIGAGALFGAILGFLQLRGISAATGPLLAARTAPEVRRAMMNSKAGRASIYGIWVFTFLQVMLATMVKGTPPMGIVTGLASQMFVRDLIALKGCYLLQRCWEGRKERETT